MLADGAGWVMANPVGTGPYRLKEWRRAQRIVLEANPTFREEVYPESSLAEDRAIMARLRGKKLPLAGRIEIGIIEESNPRLLASGNFTVAESEAGAIIGCGGWSKERPGSNEIAEGIGHVRHFATHPKWLHRGIGRAIFETCVKQAEAAGIGRFQCYSSLVAIPFYEACENRPQMNANKRQQLLTDLAAVVSGTGDRAARCHVRPPIPEVIAAVSPPSDQLTTR